MCKLLSIGIINILNMNTLKNINILPPPPPLDSGFYKEWEGGFTFPVAPYPVEHLIGKLALEDRVDSIAVRIEQGLPLETEELELLRLDHELAFDHFEAE
jgi:hypothetical protein